MPEQRWLGPEEVLLVPQEELYLRRCLEVGQEAPLSQELDEREGAKACQPRWRKQPQNQVAGC